MGEERNWIEMDEKEKTARLRRGRVHNIEQQRRKKITRCTTSYFKRSFQIEVHGALADGD